MSANDSSAPDTTEYAELVLSAASARRSCLCSTLFFSLVGVIKAARSDDRPLSLGTVLALRPPKGSEFLIPEPRIPRRELPTASEGRCNVGRTTKSMEVLLVAQNRSLNRSSLSEDLIQFLETERLC